LIKKSKQTTTRKNNFVLEPKNKIRENILLNPELLGATEINDDEGLNGDIPEKVLKKEMKESSKKVLPDNLSPQEREKAIQTTVIPNMTVDEAQEEVENLEAMFSGDGQTESSILKELFSNKNIKLKTELTEDQVSIVSRLELMATITKRPYLQIVLNEFLTLQVSKERKSRAEFVEAHKDRNQQANKGILNGLLGGGNGG
jgi:hypothetical protein